MSNQKYTPPTDEQIDAAIDAGGFPQLLPPSTEALAKAFIAASNISLEPVKDSPCRNTCVTHGRCSCGTQYHRVQQQRRLTLSGYINAFMAGTVVQEVQLLAADIPVDLTDITLHLSKQLVRDFNGKYAYQVSVASLPGNSFLQILYTQDAHYYYWRVRNITNTAWEEWSKASYESDKE